MGPEATLDCFAKIIKNSPPEKDQDHLRVIIDYNPKEPDRTAAIFGNGKSPTPILVEGCRALERAGADFIIIPCVSDHFFLNGVQDQINLPIISIYDAVADTIVNDHSEIKTVGLLAATATINGGLFQKRLARDGIQTIVSSDATQSKIMAAIYDIKNTRSTRSREEITQDLISAAETLISQKAEGIIAGCTEIPLYLKKLVI